MDWHELEKMKVTDLREMAKDKTSLEGVVGMTKEHLVEELAKVLGIPKPHKVSVGREKSATKKQIRETQSKVAAALEQKNHVQAKLLRREIHHLKRKLRRQAKVAV
jgi:hypothetical protein